MEDLLKTYNDAVAAAKVASAAVIAAGNAIKSAVDTETASVVKTDAAA